MPKNKVGNIYWIFGNSGAGKTTLARKLRPRLHAIILDGDDLRTVWKLGLSRADRFEQNLRIARLARLLARQGYNVIVATICPYNELRHQVAAICQPVWVYLRGGRAASEEYPFEEPDHEYSPAYPVV